MRGLRWAATAIAAIVFIPILIVVAVGLTASGDIWPHLRTYVLPELLRNTLVLVLGVGVGTGVLGVSLAWFTALYEFPGRKFFAWALMLPLALPSYVLAFVAIGLLDYTGPVQTMWRAAFGEVWFPPIRSPAGVVIVMTLALYPYVFLVARNAFLTQGTRALEAAQSLGLTRTRAFFRVALPLARPWIVAGLTLALMETLADFGAVAIFNYDTFTTAIYKTWFAMFSLPTAAQLASLLVLAVLILIWLEWLSRRRMRFFASGRSTVTARLHTSRRRAIAMSLYCAAVLTIAFAIPFAQVLWWAGTVATRDLDARYFDFLWHSLLLAALAAALTTALALILAYAQRRHRGTAMQVTVRTATLGYAVPGAVLAVGIFIPIVWLDRYLRMAGEALLGAPVGAILQGTLAVMLLAYAIRFLAAGFGPVEAALQRITPTVEEAARGFGLRAWTMWRAVHLPILRRGLLTAGILVFVDVMKEMPITLMTRPFGWDTMAVRVFEMTSEGEWERAALPAAAIVLASLVSILILTRLQEKHRA